MRTSRPILERICEGRELCPLSDPLSPYPQIMLLMRPVHREGTWLPQCSLFLVISPVTSCGEL